MLDQLRDLSRFLFEYVTGREARPWGEFINFKVARVKTLRIEPHQAISYQYHKKRSELWVVLAGDPVVRLGDETTSYKCGERILIPVGQKHQVSAGQESVIILELSFGEFDESDIVRLEDPYNRDQKENT